jgi:hypothetical protein
LSAFCAFFRAPLHCRARPLRQPAIAEAAAGSRGVETGQRGRCWQLYDAVVRLEAKSRKMGVGPTSSQARAGRISLLPEQLTGLAGDGGRPGRHGIEAGGRRSYADATQPRRFANDQRWPPLTHRSSPPQDEDIRVQERRERQPGEEVGLVPTDLARSGGSRAANSRRGVVTN